MYNLHFITHVLNLPALSLNQYIIGVNCMLIFYFLCDCYKNVIRQKTFIRKLCSLFLQDSETYMYIPLVYSKDYSFYKAINLSGGN